MRMFGGRVVIVLAAFLGVVACSTPDKRPPESAGRPVHAAQVWAWSREDLAGYERPSVPGVRGTQKYRAPSLAGVWARSPYLHDGSVRTMQERLTAGHDHGTDLPVAQKRELIEHLERL